MSLQHDVAIITYVDSMVFAHLIPLARIVLQVLQNPEELGRYEPAVEFLKWAVPLASDSHDRHLYSAVCFG